jgi:hypothetical protein
MAANGYERIRKRRLEDETITPDSGVSTGVSTSEMSDTLARSMGVNSAQARTKGVELIADGFPNEGKIYRLPDGTLNYVSNSYSTRDLEEIARISRTKGQGQTDPSQSFFNKSILEDPTQAGGSEAAKWLYEQPWIGSRSLGAIENASGYEGLEKRAMAGKAALEEQRPITSAGMTIGSLASGGALTYGLGGGLLDVAKKIPGVPQFLASTVGNTSPIIRAGSQATATGAGAAAEGAVYASGEEGANTLFRAGLQGGLGFVLGLLPTPVGALINKYANRKSKTSIANDIASEFGVSIVTARFIEKQIVEGMDFNQALKNIKKAGNEGMLVDADLAAQKLMDAAMQASSATSRQGAQAIDQRVGRSVAKIEKGVEKSLGKATDKTLFPYEQVQAKNAVEREQAYNVAFNTPINYGTPKADKLQNIFMQIGKSNQGQKIINKAVDMANDEINLAAAKGSKAPFQRQIQMNLDADGKLIGFSENPNIYQIDSVKRQLQSLGQERGANGMFTPEAMQAQQWAGLLREAAIDVVPQYGKAVKIGGETIADRNAYKIGENFFKKDSDYIAEVERIRKSGGKDTQDALKLGVRNTIRNVVDDAMVAAGKGDPNEIEAARKILKSFSSRGARERLINVLGDAEANKLLRLMDQAKTSFELKAKTATGSATAGRTEVISQAKDAVKLGAAKSIGELDVGSSAKQIREIFQSTNEQERLNQLFSESITLLTDRRGRSAQAAIKYLKEAMDGVTPTDNQYRFITEEISKALAKSGSIYEGRERIPATIVGP